MLELKIGTSWVRGVVGEALTPELIVNFACAFGTWAEGGPVVIGRDPRNSSFMLRAAVISGLLSRGSEIIDLGICPTPLVSFAARELGAAGGLSITGGHNDQRWNALKFIGPDGTLLNAVKSEELLDIFHASAYASSPGGSVAPQSETSAVQDRYLGHLLSSLDVEAIRSRKFRVAVDFCNGACHDVMAAALGELGCTLLPLNEKPSRQFAHLPAPTTANMRELESLMRRVDADLGAAVNVDGDRVALVTAAGRVLSEEHTLPLAAESRLARRPGALVTNLSTSRMVDAVASRYHQTVFRTSVGEGHVMDRGIEENAVVAGEGSGGVGALPVTMTFDAVLTLGMVLESMARTDRTCAELAEQLPRFVMRKGAIPCSPDQVYRVLEVFRAAFSDRAAEKTDTDAGDGDTEGVDTTDGLRVEWADAWVHVRASNTEPLLRVIVEAETDTRARQIFDDAMSRGQEALRRTRESPP